MNVPSMYHPSLMPEQVTPRSIELMYDTPSMYDNYPHQHPAPPKTSTYSC